MECADAEKVCNHMIDHQYLLCASEMVRVLLDPERDVDSLAPRTTANRVDLGIISAASSS